MIRKLCGLLLILGSSTLQITTAQQLSSPSEFLGYTLGTQFTFHHQILEYVNYIAENSDRVSLKKIGKSYEGRDLVLLFISTEKNQSQLETIRINNLKRAKLVDGNADATMPIIVWLSYNVCGNEAVSSEAALQTLYELVSTQDPVKLQWLSETLVVMDPCLNPDGRDRYVTWYKQTKGIESNLDPNSREHDYQWASGRTNHYYFDLNRDWAWMTQIETQARIENYSEWMPQVHVDFHEQGYNEPYYFAPAAEPIHPVVTGFQKTFQAEIGANHARYFDEKSWLFFTRQRFDLFYPSYGDSWPTFNGSIGMTYEQGGINAGLQVIKETSDTLRLTNRIEHHYTTGISTIEAAVKGKQELEKQFTDYFKKSVEKPGGEYKSYILKNTGSESLQELMSFLKKQGISCEKAPNGKSVTGYSYFSDKNETYKIQTGDILVSAYQAKSNLLTVLFDPKPSLSDSVTYDITSWALPWVFGVETIASNQKLNGDGEVTQTERSASPVKNAQAYIFSWDSFTDAKFLADLYKHDFRIRQTEITMQINGQDFKPGAILVLKADNMNQNPNYDSELFAIAEKFGVELHAISSGYVEKGVDLGSSDIKFLKKPSIAVCSSDDINSSSVGEVWHYFDQLLGYPISIIEASSINRMNITMYDVLILPSGSYNEVLNDKVVAKLKEWVTNGGTLIALNSANNWMSKLGDLSTLKRSESNNVDSNAVPGMYADRERNYISASSPGAYFSTKTDATHPLAYGYSKGLFSLRLNEQLYEPLKDGWNVSTISKENHISGFIGSVLKKNMKTNLIAGNEKAGKGNLVYITENILFRAFLYHNQLMMANAVFFVGQTR